MRSRIWLTCALVCLGSAAQAHHCPPGYLATDAHKSRKLYLYFPNTSPDNQFPLLADADFLNHGWGSEPLVSPAQPFNAALLGPTVGDRSALINGIRGVVVDDFCEFNVEVLVADGTSPDASPTAAHRSIVAIGSDSNCSGGSCDGGVDGPKWGSAQVDVADTTGVSYGRVWAGTHLYTTIPALITDGVSPTARHWELALGGSASHEGAHTFGVRHECCGGASFDCTGECVRTGEDDSNNHLMLPQPVEHDRHATERHFSDRSFSLLASHVGLTVQTVHNWDFVNPNNAAARRLEMIVMVRKRPERPDWMLTSSWVYSGSLSPWSGMEIHKLPSVPDPPADNPNFPPADYDVYRLVWRTPQSWSGGAEGEVPAVSATGGPAKFHIGATFSDVAFDQPDPVIIRDVALYTATVGGTRLPLSPRMFGYDTGGIVGAGGGAGEGAGAARAEAPAPGMRPGDFRIRFFNDRPGQPLILRNLVVHELPRVASIETMVRGAKLASWDGVDVIPWRSTQLGDFTVKDVLDVKIATLSQKRHIFEDHRRREGEIEKGKKEKGAKGESAPELNKSIEVRQGGPPGGPHGPATIDIDLFPSTTVYITARVFDPSTNLESGLFYQFAGFHPDLDNNGVDDVIDIATGEARDADGDGIPDPPRPWWIVLLLSLLGALALLILIIVLVRRRAAAPR